MAVKYTIAFGSATLALKSQALLNNNNIRTTVIKTPKNLSSGCGYSIWGYGDVSKITAVLDQNNIKYKAVTEEK